jgi:hypothetical protein
VSQVVLWGAAHLLGCRVSQVQALLSLESGVPESRAWLYINAFLPEIVGFTLEEIDVERVGVLVFWIERPDEHLQRLLVI